MANSHSFVSNASSARTVSLPDSDVDLAKVTQPASLTEDGYLSTVDWSTFNGKQDALPSAEPDPTTKYLRGDGTWQVPDSGITVISVASGTLVIPDTGKSFLIIATGDFTLDAHFLAAGQQIEIQAGYTVAPITVTLSVVSPITSHRGESNTTITSYSLLRQGSVVVHRVGNILYLRKSTTVVASDFAIQRLTNSPDVVTFNTGALTGSRSLVLPDYDVRLGRGYEPKETSFTAVVDGKYFLNGASITTQVITLPSTAADGSAIEIELSTAPSIRTITLQRSGSAFVGSAGVTSVSYGAVYDYFKLTLVREGNIWLVFRHARFATLDTQTRMVNANNVNSITSWATPSATGTRTITVPDTNTDLGKISASWAFSASTATVTQTNLDGTSFSASLLDSTVSQIELSGAATITIGPNQPSTRYSLATVDSRIFDLTSFTSTRRFIEIQHAINSTSSSATTLQKTGAVFKDSSDATLGTSSYVLNVTPGELIRVTPIGAVGFRVLRLKEVNIQAASFVGASDSNSLSGTRNRIVGGNNNTVRGTDNAVINSNSSSVVGTNNLILASAVGDGFTAPATNDIGAGTVRSAIISSYGCSINGSLSDVALFNAVSTTASVSGLTLLGGRLVTAPVPNSVVHGGLNALSSIRKVQSKVFTTFDGTLRTLTENGSATESAATLVSSAAGNILNGGNVGFAAMHRIRIMGGNGGGAPYRQVMAERVVWVRRRSTGNSCVIEKTDTPTADISLDGITLDLQIDLVGTSGALLRIRAADTSGTHGTAGVIMAHIESHYMGI